MSKVDFIQRRWRSSMRILAIMPFVLAAITGFNIWNDLEQGRPFDGMHLLYFAGFMLWIGFMYIFMRLIFKFLLARARHEEKRST